MKKLTFVSCLFLIVISTSCMVPLYRQLEVAALAGNEMEVRHLLPSYLEEGESLNQSNCKMDGRCLLHLVAEKGITNIIPILIEHSANINIEDAMEMTPLHLAAINGHLDACQTLIENQATLDFPDFQGLTPLHRAIQKNHWDVARLINPPRYQMLAFLQARHPRLGKQSKVSVLPENVFQHIYQFLKPAN